MVVKENSATDETIATHSSAIIRGGFTFIHIGTTTAATTTTTTTTTTTCMAVR